MWLDSFDGPGGGDEAERRGAVRPARGSGSETFLEADTNITYHFFHWKKGTPFAADDQGIYSRLTWWEQIDNGQRLTRNRKFFYCGTCGAYSEVRSSRYLIAWHLTDYKQPMFFLNTMAVFVLVIAKIPNMHKVRIFGINADI
ncbi:unnamed protein product [Miscanthus lutarioriparius]|uniref:Uncharacterized protein n=1 Tax=Miscanthus lutarioriparius TaxID=422564 RepID=A0A811PPM3_9POAL|nr:unnamed protein product [Miscanthus lutarioriparius]